jgi:high-affinity nickel-transport protein
LVGAFWDGLSHLSDNFGLLGFVIIGIFILSWVVSTVVYKIRRYDELDARLSR